MRVKPYKFSPINFENKFDVTNSEIIYKIMDINSSRKAIDDIHILPNWAEYINEKIVTKLMVQSIHGTLAIEGNPSTEKEIEKTYKNKIDIRKIKERKKQEQYNIKNACNFIKKVGKRPQDKTRIKITEDIIKKLHEIITFNTYENNNIPGRYRNFLVEVGEERFGGIYRPPKILADIKILMNGYIEWLNTEETRKLIPILRAILAHYYLAIIHPFGDGNGRVARALESLILYNFGFKYDSSFSLWRYYYENYEEYFTLLNKTRKNNKGELTEFIIFVLTLLQNSIDNIRSSIRMMIDGLLFKDYVRYLYFEKVLTSRQYAIMNFLSERPDNINIKELGTHPVIIGLYKGNKSKTRLFQLDMKHLIYELGLLKKINAENQKKEILIPNIDIILNSSA